MLQGVFLSVLKKNADFDLRLLNSTMQVDQRRPSAYRWKWERSPTVMSRCWSQSLVNELNESYITDFTPLSPFLLHPSLPSRQGLVYPKLPWNFLYCRGWPCTWRSCLLPLHPKFWDFGSTPPPLTSVVLYVDYKTLHTVDKFLANWIVSKDPADTAGENLVSKAGATWTSLAKLSKENVTVLYSQTCSKVNQVYFIPGFYYWTLSGLLQSTMGPTREVDVKDRRAESKGLGADVFCDQIGVRICMQPEMSSSLTTGGLPSVR